MLVTKTGQRYIFGARRVDNITGIGHEAVLTGVLTLRIGKKKKKGSSSFVAIA